jgi:putative nucleotidyltransferase with HDIG domain
MNTYPLPLPADTPAQSGAVEVARRLQAAGFIAYWAGGCVRDLILRRTPKDYDIATNALPERVLELFPESVSVGKSFGVIRTQVAGHWYEVATFRKDAAYLDGRHPSAVTFSDPGTDAQRRDFTINAIFYDPVRREILDYVYGTEAIQRRVIATVGDPRSRFQEDHLRLLRAVRFAATLDFALDPATADAIRATASRIATVSAERVRDELSRLLTEALHAGDAVAMLRDLGLLDVILPEVSAMSGTQQPPEFHPEGDVFQHTLIMLNALHKPDLQLAWATLLHDVGKPPTAQLKDGRWRFERHAPVGAEAVRTILTRLRFPTDDITAISFMVGNHMRFVNVSAMRRSTLRQLVGAPTFPKELELHRLDCQASHGQLDNYDYLLEFQNRMRSEPVLPKPWITGRDILALGIPEGPQVGVWRKQAYEAQLDGTFPNREALLEWLKRQIELAVPARES